MPWTAAISAVGAVGASALSGGGSSSHPLAADFSFPTTNPTFRFNIGPTGNDAVITTDRGFQRDLDKFSALSNTQADEIRGLRGQVAPGFGRLTSAQNDIFDAALSRLGDERRASRGDLRNDLSRRRVLGTSFARDQITNQDAVFDRQELEITNARSEATAQSLLAEIDASARFINAEFSSRLAGVERLMAGAEFVTQASTPFTTGMSGALGNISSTVAQLNAQAQAGLGASLQPLIDSVGDEVGGILSDIFGTGAPATT